MTYAFLDDRANEHDKQVAIGGAASWYWACGLMYCRRNETRRRAKGLRVDLIPKAAALGLYSDPLAADHVKAILRVGLWEELDAENYVVHDYHKVYTKRESDPQPPAEDQQPPAKRLSPGQLEARRAGGLARAATASRTSNGLLGPPAKLTSNGPAAPSSSGSRSLGSGSGSAGSGSGSLTEITTTKDLTGTQQPAEPITAVVVVVGGSSDLEDPGRETMCPTDLVERLEANGTVRLLAEKLAAPIESVRAALRGFEAYWIIGKGAGQRRTGWTGKARQWVVDQAAKPGGLPAPGAVAHAAYTRAADDGLEARVAQIGRTA